MGIDLLGVSLAFGLTVVAMAYAIGHISGCHLNPAVPLGLVAGGRFDKKDALPYIARPMRAFDVLEKLARLFLEHGPPDHIRSDDSPELTVKVLRKWLGSLDVKTLDIAAVSPWGNGCVESFNARLRDELLNGDRFYTLAEPRAVIRAWTRHYNQVRPHASLGYRPPAPLAILPAIANISSEPTIGG